MEGNLLEDHQEADPSSQNDSQNQDDANVADDESQEQPRQQQPQLSLSEQEAIRAKTNRVLNYVDFALLLTLVLLMLILITSTEAFTDEPLMMLIFLAQIYTFYLMFRVKYAINLPLLWCGSCNEPRHIRYHFCNGFFAAFTIFCDVLDFFRSMIPKTGLYQKNKGLFVLEIFSFFAAISVLVLIWKCPRLILSRRAANREIDASYRRRRRFNYGVPDQNPEELARREAEYRALHPNYEDLQIEDVFLDRSVEGDLSDVEAPTTSPLHAASLEEALSASPGAQPTLLRRSSSVSSNVSLVNDNTCSICLEDFKAGEVAKSLPECSHMFHDHCLKQWYNAGIPSFQNQGVNPEQLMRHKTCPKCRRRFSVRNSSSSQRMISFPPLSTRSSNSRSGAQERNGPSEAGGGFNGTSIN